MDFKHIYKVIHQWLDKNAAGVVILVWLCILLWWAYKSHH